MFIDASMVGTIALGSLGKIVNFSKKTVICFHLFVFVITHKMLSSGGWAGMRGTGS